MKMQLATKLFEQHVLETNRRYTQDIYELIRIHLAVQDIELYSKKGAGLMMAA
jgi:hypothetical protein